MLKSPQIMIFRELLYNWFRIESRELKECTKLPDRDLYTDNTQKFKLEKRDTAQISISWSLQNSLRSIGENGKVS
jgi:hypothetical protein